MMNFIDLNPVKIRTVLEKVESDTKPLWGKMTYLQMINHLIHSFKMGNGKTKAPYEPSVQKAQKFQEFLVSDHPMPRLYDAAFAEVSIETPFTENIDEAVGLLIEEIQFFLDEVNKNPKQVYMNPEFGSLNLKQWERLHKKHLTHHFQQFQINV